MNSSRNDNELFILWHPLPVMLTAFSAHRSHLIPPIFSRQLHWPLAALQTVLLYPMVFNRTQLQAKKERIIIIIIILFFRALDRLLEI